MKIYPVTAGYDYEGSSLLVVFATLELAENYVDQLNAIGDSVGDWIDIHEHDLMTEASAIDNKVLMRVYTRLSDDYGNSHYREVSDWGGDSNNE